MKLFTVILLLSMWVLPADKLIAESGSASGAPITEVIPNVYADTNGTATFLGPFANAQRTYQMLIHANQLTNLVGKKLTALTFRLPVSATTDWPASDITFANYDIYLSGSVDPANRSLTFANNIVGPRTQVRSGPLTITTGSFTFGNVPNAFGSDITLNINCYVYTGGNLLIEIRHQGFSGTSRNLDAIGTAIAGYGTNFSACWTSNYTGTSGAQGNFCVARLTADDAYQLDLTGLIEGLYDGNSNMMVSDTTNVVLRSTTTPYNVVETSRGVLNSSGNGTFYFCNVVNGTDYYIVINHRNSIDTWSNMGYSFSSNQLTFDFSNAASQAYGSNQVQEGSRYAAYSGDANKDGTIDASDVSLIDNDAFGFVGGYVATDLNGDLFVDASDYSIADNNAFNFIAVVSPPL